MAAFLKEKANEDSPLSTDELENAAGGACNKETGNEVGMSIASFGVACWAFAIISAKNNSVGQENE